MDNGWWQRSSYDLIHPSKLACHLDFIDLSKPWASLNQFRFNKISDEINYELSCFLQYLASLLQNSGYILVYECILL
jgi:hypothetical protein